ncbi:hypothetical protein M2152_001524 [Microbacteriaceae bacterium SG_E_30_P1]|uniref:Gram-positive cocci surface proteins LPxTG domain-containing protein n=1 Tax=Antiquaquibacter oligotrophicus TaxID=2880260 RepID=A0ABT6KMU9_9MICO|nr:hypothetical protein [Antiquaquibacter oligotrophicus]MDH6181342.1 hypothetical protein [Antiquaquibacter oligotrophicus]UDF12965.1 hypothetical protein LH407_12495 [Antiquaquibacter oligotrophicus]
MKTSRKIGASAAAGILALALPLAGSTAAFADTPMVVDITVKMDLPHNASSSGPIVYAVTGVTVGDGPELTAADLVENPSGWCGTLDVDIDNTTKAIYIYTDTETGEVCDFQTVSVTITSDQIGSVTLVEDTLFDEEEEVDGEEPPVLTNSEYDAAFAEQVNNGVWTFDYNVATPIVQLDWATLPVEFEGEEYYQSLDTAGYTILSYAAPAPAPPALAATGSESPALIAGIAAGILLLGAAAVTTTAIARRAGN